MAKDIGKELKISFKEGENGSLFLAQVDACKSMRLEVLLADLDNVYEKLSKAYGALETKNEHAIEIELEINYEKPKRIK